MAGRIEKPLVRYDCVGTVSFRSGETYCADFSVKQLQDGTIAGTLLLHNLQEGLSLIMTTSELDPFELEGQERASGFPSRVEDCHFTRRWSGAMSLQGEFIAFIVIVRPDLLERRIERGAFAVVSITNMYKTFRVILDGPLGTMQIAHEPDIDDLEQLMRYQKISLVTSYVEIFAEGSTGKLVRELIHDVEDVTRGFLSITRLAQTCWHDWCNIRIYEKDETGERFQLLAIKMRVPWKKPPVDRGITNVAHSDLFIRNAYASYNTELETKHGFETAIHWYVESNAGEVIETKYLLACTCLELLTDRLAKQRGEEFILDKATFKELYQFLKEKLLSWSIEKGVPESKRKLTEQTLLGLNRSRGR